MRTRAVRAAVAAAAVLATAALAACGADDTNSSTSGAADASGRFPVTIDHKFGSTKIPSEPKRVVTVGYTEQDMVLALGVRPVGTRDFLGGYDYKKRPWAQKALGGTEIPSVGGEEISFEKVAAQRPDLILGINSGITKSDYQRLSKIAPTVPQSDDFIDFGVPWPDQTLAVGKALGREVEARKLVDDVKAQLARTRKEHPELDGRLFVLAYASGGKFGAYSSQDFRSRFFADLGLKPDKEIDRLAGKSFYIDLDREQFRLLDKQLVVMFGTREDVEKDPALRRLKAVAEGRVVYLDLGDQFAGALGFSSPLSLPFLVREAVPKLSAAVDGDPETTGPDPR
jgi:iron complex transport system substrate-binding protein